jgi:V8-like Glu-specific endopeptidase
MLLASVTAIASPVDKAAYSARAQAAQPAAAIFRGTPAVGALFVATGSGLGAHFCTASVVHSPKHDLVITAAHCLAGVASSPKSVTFVPGYRDGVAPYGVWSATQVIVDNSWAASADPDDDVAFLVIAGRDANTEVEDVTGAERLGIGAPATSVVQVTGYPISQERPVTCQSRASQFSARQMRFDCGGFTDGTSGGPFLVGVSTATGAGTVIGVIGGYQQGGFTPDISYSPTFGPNIASLYQTAAAAG